MSTYYGLVMPQVYTGGVYIKSIKQTKTSEESGGTNEITATLTNRTKEVFYIKNGVSAGFGRAEASANTLEPGKPATAEIEVSGDDFAKEFSFTFGIPKGEPFAIYRTFPDTAAMNADTSVPDGKFVMIASDVEDEDNARLYVRTADGYSFITDLSGAQGIKGDKGDPGAQGEKGDKGAQGPKGDPGELTAESAVAADVADANYAVGIKASGEVTKTLWSAVWTWIKGKIESVAHSPLITSLRFNTGLQSSICLYVEKLSKTGSKLVIGADGNTHVGGGESAYTIANAVTRETEYLYLSSDENVRIITGVQEGVANAKTTEFRDDGSASFPGDIKLAGKITSVGTALTASNPITNTNPGWLAAGQMQLHTVYNGGGPAPYGNLLNIGGSGGGQLFLGWSGAQSEPGDSNAGALYYRSKRDNVNGFTAWRQVQFVGGGEISPHTAWKAYDVPEFAEAALQQGSFYIDLNLYTKNGVYIAPNNGDMRKVKKEGGDDWWFVVSWYDYLKYFPLSPPEVGTSYQACCIGIKMQGSGRISVKASGVSSNSPRTLVLFRALTGEELATLSVPTIGDYLLTYDYEYPGYPETLWMCTKGQDIGIKAIAVN